jgi:hypothetical protein
VRDGESVRELDRTSERPLPSVGFVVWGLVLTLYASSALIPPVHPGDIAFGVFTAAWWVVAILLMRGVRGAIVPALVLVAGLVLIVLALEARRTALVLRGGDVEAEYGVPISLATLQRYWLLEAALVFLPLAVIAMRLHAALRSDGPDRAN